MWAGPHRVCAARFNHRHCRRAGASGTWRSTGKRVHRSGNTGLRPVGPGLSNCHTMSVEFMTTTSIIALSVAAAACVTDLRSRRIPNVLTLGAALAAMVFAGVSGGWAALLSAGAGWVVGAAVFFLPFALGGLGAGDVKLLAALGAWLGPHDAIWVALYTGIAGGIGALIVAAANGYLKQALTNVKLLLIH